MEVDGTEEKGCTLTDDNCPEEEKLVSAPKEETEMDQRDGAQNEDYFGAGSDINGDEVVECTDNRRKRNIIDHKGETDVDSVKKQKVKDEVGNGKLQVVGRVLRSRTTVKSEGEEKLEDEQSNGGFVEKSTRGRSGSEEERIKANKEERDHFNGEDSFQSSSIFVKRKRGRPPKALQSEFQQRWGNAEKREIDQSAVQGSCKKLKRKRGRPPKALQSEFEQRWGNVEKREIDQSAVQVSCKKLKRKRGRPPKSRENDVSEKKHGDDGHQQNSEEIKKLKPRRGRPPKSRENDVSEKKHGDDGHQQNSEEIKKLKPRRGRPPKAWENDESQKKMGDVDKEKYQPTSEEIKKVKPRRGRPPKAQESNWSEKRKVKIEEEESDQCATKESVQPNNQAREILKSKLGRPPKAQKFDGSAKKMFEVANAGSDQSADEEGDERTKLEPNYGKLHKGNKGKKVGALRKYKRGTTLKHSSSLSGKRFFGQAHNMKLLPVKIECNNEEKEGGNTKQKAGEMRHSRSERQAVRDKIVELLLAAGWEIQYRPRNGREYQDAVYVNPEGRTHWSITLAYRVLKEHYEGFGGDSKTCESSFKFTPIPDEEINMLTKVMNKERSDKNKKKKKWNQEEKGEKMIEVINKKKWKLHKRKLGAVAGVGYKKLKRRTKPKSLHHKQDDSAVTSGEGAAVSVRGRKRLETHGRKRCALLVRNSQEGKESDGDGYVLYNGKRTVLTWMLGLGTVLLDEKVQYLKRRKTRGVLKGRITTDGIQCDCCTKKFTITEFEIHAGGKSGQPFKNIVLETGSSLLQCQLDSWHKQDESAHKGFHFIDIDGEDPNDDTCGICGDGGDLICCDSCPSTFHQSCLEIKKFPSGSWHCMYCLCKFCGRTAGNICQRDDNDTALLCALLTCSLCEEKYHGSCVQVKGAMSDDLGSSSFCGKKCQELYERLQTLFGVKHELEEGFSWTFIRRFDVGSDISHSGMPQKVESNSKVAVALHIMDECFLPMVDHRSGVNLIRNIVFNFGSNFNRLNYSGFFTAVLERGDEMIAAASIRIHGNHLAEMPFIGTRYMYRRQGMCRRLLCAIETALCSLNVEKLVIPAISELRETWTSVFGFKPLERSNKQILRNLNMMIFPGVDMLQKPLSKQKFAEENMNPIEGSIAGEPDAAEFGLLPDGCLNETSDIKIQDANNTEYHDQSAVVSDNLDRKIEKMVNLPDSSCNANERTENFTGQQNAFSATICLPNDNSKQELDVQMNQHNLSVVESKYSAVSQTVSEAAIVDGELPCASSGGTETVSCEVKMENYNVEHNPNTFGENSMHITAESISTQSQGRGLKVSNGDAVLHKSNAINISCDVIQSRFPAACKRVEDSLIDQFTGLPAKENFSSYKNNGPDGQETEVVVTTVNSNDLCHVVASDITMKPNVQACMNNAHCVSIDVASGSCGDGVCDLKEVSAATQRDGISLDGGLIADKAHVNAEFSTPGSGSEVDHASVMQSNSEPFCGSSSGPGIALHCASGRVNSRGAPEVIILSNQAN